MEPVRRDDLVGVQQQDRQQRPLLARAQTNAMPVIVDHL